MCTFILQCLRTRRGRCGQYVRILFLSPSELILLFWLGGAHLTYSLFQKNVIIEYCKCFHCLFICPLYLSYGSGLLYRENTVRTAYVLIYVLPVSTVLNKYIHFSSLICLNQNYGLPLIRSLFPIVILLIHVYIISILLIILGDIGMMHFIVLLTLWIIISSCAFLHEEGVQYNVVGHVTVCASDSLFLISPQIILQKDQ
jgi:hypothetical protein